MKNKSWFSKERVCAKGLLQSGRKEEEDQWQQEECSGQKVCEDLKGKAKRGLPLQKGVNKARKNQVGRSGIKLGMLASEKVLPEGQPVLRRDCLLAQAEGRPKLGGPEAEEKLNRSWVHKRYAPMGLGDSAVQLIIYEAESRDLEALPAGLVRGTPGGTSTTVTQVIWRRGSSRWPVFQNTQEWDFLTSHVFQDHRAQVKF